MGYLHINNVYRDDRIFLFNEAYALEKIHGTSANISWNLEHGLKLFSGGEKYERFAALFDCDKLTKHFEENFMGRHVTVYGEAYGGKQQKMSETYGKDLKFVAFDVEIDGVWLNVLNAFDVVTKMGLEFVHYDLIKVTEENLNKYRDAPSVQAVRNGVEGDKQREGIVLRPLQEFIDSSGTRVISKHKHSSFSERKTKQETCPKKLVVLTQAQEIADEWVVPMRLDHVLDKLKCSLDFTNMFLVHNAMIEDVMREAEGEIEDTKAIRNAIGKAAQALFRDRVLKSKGTGRFT